MSDISYVGLLPLPIPSGGVESVFDDPTILGLLAYFRFWIRDHLAVRFQDPNSLVPDPLPEGSTYPYDPMGNWVREPVPALYMWWAGRSSQGDYSMLLSKRVRTLRMMYVFGSVPTPVAATVYAGVPAAVDAVLHKAVDRGFHTAFGYGESPAGTHIAVMLNLVKLSYDGGEPLWMAAVPATSSMPGGPSEGNITDVYPTLVAQFTVEELISQTDLGLTPDDTVDIPFGLNVNVPGDENGPLTIMQRYLVSPSENEGMEEDS